MGIAFTNVLLTLIYIIPGFISRKTNITKAEHLPSISAILVYVCSPCMIVASFLDTDRTWSNARQILLFFLVSLAIQAVLTFTLYSMFRKKFHDAKYRMLTVSFGLGNAGFFGIPIIEKLLPNNSEVACFACVYIVGMNMITFTLGAYCLTGDRKRMELKKAFINPSFISLMIALVLFAIGAKSIMPDMLMNAIRLLKSTTTPLCMIILGIRLASVSFTKLFTRAYVYIICACKLLIFPFVCLAIVYFLPANIFGEVFKPAMFILGGTPCAAVMLNLAEMYHGETELAANCVLLSTLLCVFTIPVINLVSQTLFG